MNARWILCGILLCCTAATVPPLRSQNVDIGIYRLGSDSTLELRVVPLANVTALPLSNIVFTIRWADAYGVSLGPPRSTTYSVAKQDSERVSGSYRYQKFAAATAQLVTWWAMTVYTVLSIDVHQTGSGTGTFELVNDAWTGSHNGNYYVEIAGEDRTGVIVGAQAKDVALPIELLSFTAEIDDRAVLLRWQCAEPASGGGFTVERSDDGLHWNAAGFLRADAGSAQREYSFLDSRSGRNALPPVLNYRLRVQREDGSVEYSRVLELRFDAAPGEDVHLAAWPNPARGIATANFHLASPRSVTLTLADAAGRSVACPIDQAWMPAGWHSARVDAAALPAGSYFLILRYGGRTAAAPFLVLK